MSQAESFLDQQVTTISGEVVNVGQRPVTAVILTIEFADQFGQVILRETRPAFSPSALQLAPGQQRSFDAAFERLPNDWNVQPPPVQVTDFQTLDK
ncbi:MAG TPA: FxLYD domain-containing protein [Candidatus Acidoferrum sp.]